MDGKQDTPDINRRKRSQLASTERAAQADDDEHATSISVEQLQHLVRLLDRSDVSELELRRADEGTHLVLRKAKAPNHIGQPGDALLNGQLLDTTGTIQLPASPSASVPKETKHIITAHLVGIFHRWAKPRGGTLVAVGDRIKADQLVGTIESLNVINEVESPFAGHVVEILVQEGQPVEYGQQLIIIDSPLED